MIWALLLLAAPETCSPCHDARIAEFKTHKHASAGLACVVCHGASEKHRNSNGESAPDRVAGPEEVPALCGACHASQNKDYAATKHGKLVLSMAKTRAANCNTCHGVHALKTAAQRMVQCNRCHASTPAACKQQCMACHGKHSLVAAK